MHASPISPVHGLAPSPANKFTPARPFTPGTTKHAPASLGQVAGPLPRALSYKAASPLPAAPAQKPSAPAPVPRYMQPVPGAADKPAAKGSAAAAAAAAGASHPPSAAQQAAVMPRLVAQPPGARPGGGGAQLSLALDSDDDQDDPLPPTIKARGGVPHAATPAGWDARARDKLGSPMHAATSPMGLSEAAAAAETVMWGTKRQPPPK